MTSRGMSWFIEEVLTSEGLLKYRGTTNPSKHLSAATDIDLAQSICATLGSCSPNMEGFDRSSLD